MYEQEWISPLLTPSITKMCNYDCLHFLFHPLMWCLHTCVGICVILCFRTLYTEPRESLWLAPVQHCIKITKQNMKLAIKLRKYFHEVQKLHFSEHFQAWYGPDDSQSHVDKAVMWAMWDRSCTRMPLDALRTFVLLKCFGEKHRKKPHRKQKPKLDYWQCEGHTHWEMNVLVFPCHSSHFKALLLQNVLGGGEENKETSAGL